MGRISEAIRQNIKNWLFKDNEGVNVGMPTSGSVKSELEIQEYDVWYRGSEHELAHFYSNRSFNEFDARIRENYLYANTYRSERIIHSGIPRLLADTIARLIFSGGVDVKVVDEDNEKDEDNQTRLDTIMKENVMIKNHFNSASIESAFGNVAYKISFDEEISKNIIIEIVKETNFDAIYKRGRLCKVLFTTHITENKTKFKLIEIYGKGFIDFKLFKLNRVSKWVECSLLECEETRTLAPMNEETGHNVTFDVPVILAGVKTNKTIEGRSDYAGIISEFDALDEVWSNHSEETRTSKTDIYLPQRMVIDGKTDARMVKRYVLTESQIDKEDKIEYQQPELRTEQWNGSAMSFLTNILINYGMSLATIGLADIAANASAEARRELEKASLKTRAERIKLWTEFLENFYETVLIAQDIFDKSPFVDYNIKVEFGEYITDTFDEKVKQVQILVMSQVIDGEKAIDMVFGNKITEDEKNRILENVGEKAIDDLIE